jgi:hypothetical protein
MTHDEKAPPTIGRSLKKSFFTAAFVVQHLAHWKGEEPEPGTPQHSAAMAQVRFAEAIERGEGTGSFIGDVRRFWELGNH